MTVRKCCDTYWTELPKCKLEPLEQKPRIFYEKKNYFHPTSNLNFTFLGHFYKILSNLKKNTTYTQLLFPL